MAGCRGFDYSGSGASKKKASGEEEFARPSQGKENPLADFCERLRDLCGNHGDRDGQANEPIDHTQTKHALALAAEFGLLMEPGVSWEEFLSDCPDAIIGTEHMVELDAKSGLVGKTTIPPAYGLMPKVRQHPVVRLRGGVPQIREVMRLNHRRS